MARLYSCTDGESVIIGIVHQLQKQYSESHFCTLYRPLNSQHRQIPTCLQGLQKLEIKKASKISPPHAQHIRTGFLKVQSSQSSSSNSVTDVCFFARLAAE